MIFIIESNTINCITVETSSSEIPSESTQMDQDSSSDIGADSSSVEPSSTEMEPETTEAESRDQGTVTSTAMEQESSMMISRIH